MFESTLIEHIFKHKPWLFSRLVEGEKKVVRGPWVVPSDDLRQVVLWKGYGRPRNHKSVKPWRKFMLIRMTQPSTSSAENRGSSWPESTRFASAKTSATVRPKKRLDGSATIMSSSRTGPGEKSGK